MNTKNPHMTELIIGGGKSDNVAGERGGGGGGGMSVLKSSVVSRPKTRTFCLKMYLNHGFHQKPSGSCIRLAIANKLIYERRALFLILDKS